MLKYKKMWKLKRGSNQYKTKYANHWFIRLAVIFLLVMAIAYFVCWLYENEPEPTIISPAPETRVVVKTVLASEYKVTEMEVIKMIVSEFEEFGSRVVTQALDIAYCESKYNANAVHVNKNGTRDVGVFQINSIHGYPEYQLKAAWENINIAKQMYKKSGWRPWVCRTVAH